MGSEMCIRDSHTVREQLRPNTSMLIKASHSMRFERLTEDLRKYYD